MKKFFKVFLEYYPFTLPGSVMFYSSVYFLGRGLSVSNFTAVSVSLFFLVFILAVLGFIFFYSRIQMLERIIWKADGVIDTSGCAGNTQVISTGGSRPRPYSRYAIIIRGRGRTAGAVSPCFKCRYRSDNNGFFKFSFYFPFPGSVNGELNVFIEDIFALVRIRVLSEKLQDFAVIPGLNNTVSAESRIIMKDLVTRHKKYDNDIEKYLMREYVPGDLYRDINWKSSGRIDKLVTRISPGGREESNLVTFIYLGSSSISGSAFRKFIKGKYFMEFFYTFLVRAREICGDCEFQIIVDGKKCIVKEFSDFYKAGALLASSAASQAFKDKQTDLTFLSEIPAGSSLCLFAENEEILFPALKKLSSDRVSACFIPEITFDPEGSCENHIQFRDSDFIFSALYQPYSFYGSAALSRLKSGNRKNGRGAAGLPGYRIKTVEIRMKKPLSKEQHA